MMDSTRLTQWGKWSGRIVADGTEIPIDAMYGTKDRSWGVRPVGDPDPAAPGAHGAADLLPLGAHQLGRLLHALSLLRARQR